MKGIATAIINGNCRYLCCFGHKIAPESTRYEHSLITSYKTHLTLKPPRGWKIENELVYETEGLNLTGNLGNYGSNNIWKAKLKGSYTSILAPSLRPAIMHYLMLYQS